MRGRRTIAVAAAAVLLALTAGCGSDPSSTDSTGPSLSASGSTPGSPSASQPQPSEEPTPTPTTSAPPTIEPTATTPAPAGDACPSSSLTVAALPGSGSSGTQYEIVQFTNTSTAACSMTGFPAVSLRRSGAALGEAASPSSTPASTVRLEPGAVVTALLSGPSTCDAPLSDALRVTAPGASGFVDVPGEVRGCPLTVDPVTAA